MGNQEDQIRIPDRSHDHKAVAAALEQILQSPPFRATRQCQDLLRYIVTHTLSGEHEALRERLIGIEVFGRKPDYDTGNDPVVRIRAADMRKRLAQYYQNLGQAEVPVRIDVPSGSYRANFQLVESRKKTRGESEAQRLEAAARSRATVASFTRKAAGHWRLVAASLLVVLAGATAFLIARRTHRSPESDFDRFWSSFVASPKPLLVCVGSNAVYRLSDNFQSKYRESHHLENMDREAFVDLPRGAVVKAEDIVPQPNTFVGVADMAASSQVVALLARKGKAYQHRSAGDVAFVDLRHVPVVLVGGFSNPWAMEMTSDLRFVLAGGERIEDRQDRNRVWSTVRAADGVTTDDYAVVSRLQNGKNGDALLVLAGIGSYGTQAAGEFVVDPQLIGRLASAAPPGWSTKNMQVVLHIHVVHLAPSTVEVAAVYFW